MHMDSYDIHFSILDYVQDVVIDGLIFQIYYQYVLLKY
jgi:hypothetical protein